jgi:DNA-binding CsgD family transcriptional regulator
MQEFLRLMRFLEIRRIAYESCCGAKRSSVKTHNRMHSASLCDQSSIQAFASLKLTRREAEVLFWISRGKSNHEIGIILGAKTGTICKHVEHILTKLNVENRTSAAVVALETSRSFAETTESKSSRPWTAVAGVVAAQFAELWLGGLEICDALSLVA